MTMPHYSMDIKFGLRKQNINKIRNLNLNTAYLCTTKPAYVIKNSPSFTHIHKCSHFIKYSANVF